MIDAAIRETKEEIGVEIKNPEQVGLFHFTFANKEEWNQDVYLFLTKEWVGEPSESEEMMPKWFSFNEIPYENMWPDDIHWLPQILKGKKLDKESIEKRVTNTNYDLVSQKRTKNTNYKAKAEKCKKPILQFTKDNIFIKEWKGAIDAEKELNIPHGGISNCLAGRQKISGNFIWKFK
jgi:ADP-ribose pyrophosphatase YjhB (NUDIX family)